MEHQDITDLSKPLVIVQEYKLWMLLEREEVTEGWIANMLGTDLLSVRTRYADYCAQVESPTLENARQLLIEVGVEPEQATIRARAALARVEKRLATLASFVRV